MKKNIFILGCVILFGPLKAQDDTATKGTVYKFVQVAPRFHGDLNAFLSSHIKYPASAIKNHIEGTVIVSFMVEKDGEVSGISLLRGVSPDLDEEALRVVSALPAWSLGYQAGNAVRVQEAIPVKFLLDSIKLPDKEEVDTTLTYQPDVQPKFNGDLDGYLKAHLQYPKSAIDIAGTVYITFIVSKTGAVKSPMVLRGADTAFDREALSFVSNMPDWIPGTIQGKPVSVQYTLPIHFTLETKSADIPDNFNPPETPDSKPAPSPSTPMKETFCGDTREGFWIEPHVGIGTSWIFMDQGNSNTIAGSPVLGFSAGCDLSMMFNDHSGFVTGINIQQYGSHYSSGSNMEPQFAYPPTASVGSASDTSTNISNSTSVTYSFTYLEVPIMYRYVTSDACHIGFHLEGGLILGYLISASESGSISESINQWTKEGQSIAVYYTYLSNNTLTEPANTSPNASKLDIGLAFKFGVNTPLTSKISLAIDLVPQWKLTNTGDGTKDVVNFGNEPYSYYGPGNYGGGFSFFIEMKLLFQL